MQWLKLNATWKNSAFANRALVISNVALCLSLVFGASFLSAQHERIVIVPAGLTNNTSVEWGSADREYHEAFALYIAGLIGQISASNYKSVLSQAEIHLDPAVYAQVRKNILALVNDSTWQKSGGAHWFVAEKRTYEDSTGRVYINGTLNVASPSGEPVSKNIVVQVKTEMRNGRPIVAALDTYPGVELRTAKWEAAHKAMIAARAENEKRTIPEMEKIVEAEIALAAEKPKTESDAQ